LVISLAHIAQIVPSTPFLRHSACRSLCLAIALLRRPSIAFKAACDPDAARQLLLLANYEHRKVHPTGPVEQINLRPAIAAGPPDENQSS
jgi:hypothetical protein